MTNFITIPIGEHSGLTGVSLGLVRAFEQAGHQVAFFKPIAQRIQQTDHIDISTYFIHNLFHLNTPEPLSLSHVEDLVSEGNSDDLIEKIVEEFNSIDSSKNNVTIIEGIIPDPDRSYLSDKNKEIARSLNAEIILTISVQGMNARQIADALSLKLQEYAGESIAIAGYVLNRVTPNINKDQLIQEIKQQIRGFDGELPCLAIIPFTPEKSARRMYDVNRYLNSTVIAGAEHLMTNRVSEIVVAGQSATHMVDRFKAGALIVAPGDREDILMATALSTLRGIPLAGIILTCHSSPSVNLQKLLGNSMRDNIPMLLTKYDTYETARLLSEQPNHVPHDDPCRMETLVNFIAEHVNMQSLTDRLSAPKEQRFSPAVFRFRMMELARQAKKRIVLPEGAEPRTVQAAVICHQKGIARCVLLAKKSEVEEVANLHNLTLPSDLEILEPQSIASRYVAPLTELRKHKGMTPDQAKEYLEDTVVIGTMMMALGEVDGLVSGAVHTTANTIRPALQLIKTAPNASLVSSIFFMLMPSQVLVYGDCAVNPDPTAEELADIAIQSADSAAAFGIEPRVAMISYSTGSSGSGNDVEKVKKATQIAQEKRPDLLIDGPLQYDAASVPSVGKQKAPNSLVAGRATVFVFPDLNTGNTTYKAVQRSAKVLSVGPMLQGLNKPVNDLSRGALVDDIVYTIAITAIQAEQMAH